MNEIKIFRIGTERTTFVEWTINPNIGTALKTALLGLKPVRWNTPEYQRQALEQPDNK